GDHAPQGRHPPEPPQPSCRKAHGFSLRPAAGLGPRRSEEGGDGAPPGAASPPVARRASTSASTSPSTVWVPATTSTCRPRDRAVSAVTGPMQATIDGTALRSTASRNPVTAEEEVKV